MGQHAKLKVAVADQAEALHLVREELYEATGLRAEPDFQEIDRPSELLVEVRLRDVGPYTPTEIAKIVTAETQHLQVLSAWTEPAEPIPRRPVPCQVLDLRACEVPDLAFRAHRDRLPTARWHHPAPTQHPHWLLAVPGTDADGKAIVGIRRRSGYYYRFSASDADRLALTAAFA